MPSDELWTYPLYRKPGWQKEANCRGQDPNIYIPIKKHPKDTIHYDKTPCQSCPVREECLDWALANRAKKGLWGGTVPKDREKMYSRYKGRKEYGLDGDHLVGIRNRNDNLLAVDCNATPPTNYLVRMPMANRVTVHRTRITQTFIQGTLFSYTETPET